MDEEKEMEIASLRQQIENRLDELIAITSEERFFDILYKLFIEYKPKKKSKGEL